MDSQDTTSLSLEMVRRIAELSRLAISAEEELVFQKELEKVLHAFQALTTVSLPEESENSRSAFLVKELTSVQVQGDHTLSLPIQKLDDSLSRFAADIPCDSLSTKIFMDSTPDSEGVFVRVPAVLTAEH